MPVTITDKNGVVTTRHKKVDTPASPSAKSIPAPSARTKVSSEKADSLLRGLVLRGGSAACQSIKRIITEEMSLQEFEKAEALLDAPVNNENELAAGRRWAVQKILEQRGDKGWRLDAAIELAHGSKMHSKWFLPFINALVKEEGYGRIVRNHENAAASELWKMVAVADSLEMVERQYRDNPPPEAHDLDGGFISTTTKGNLYVKNPYLFKALVAHPDKAQQIAKLYVERWSLDALDEVLESPSSIAEGAL